MPIRTDRKTEDLFDLDAISPGASLDDVVGHLACYDCRRLAYDGAQGQNPGYIFRGEACFSSPLRTSLEREVEKRLGTRRTIRGGDLKAYEYHAVTSFVEGDARVAAIFYPNSKQGDDHPRQDIFWWLSLMQHYGFPTRLLDFTRDIYTALYFASEQCQRHFKRTGQELDLCVYCVPCKNLSYEYDPENNKCPFKLERNNTDMNLTLGCLIGLSWMVQHEDKFEEYLKRMRDDQEWGWDMPKYQNPRLRAQEGMFLYPYAYPAPDNPLLSGSSWLVRNLGLKRSDPFNLRASASEWSARCIRVATAHAGKLKKWLSEEKGIRRETVYERYTLEIASRI